jgi:hypothetical protein
MKKTKLILIAAIILGFFATSGLAMETGGVDIHGFISQGYIKTTENNFFGDTEDGSLEFNEFGINFGKELDDKLRVGMQILARDFGNYGNNEIVVDWAYGDYHFKDWFGVRAGKMKAPKGLYNETRDIDMLRTTIFLPQSVYPEILRDMDLGLMGGGIYGNIDLNSGGLISYQAMYGTQNVAPNEAASQALMGTTAIETPVENDSIEVDNKYVLALVWDTPLTGLRVGATYDNSDIFTTAHFTGGNWGSGMVVTNDFKTFSNTVLSAEYTMGDLVLAAEYIRTEKEYEFAFPDGMSDTQEVTADGWYLASAYQFTDWFALGAYYSESYNDTDDRDGNGASEASPRSRYYFKDLCLTTSFAVNPYWTIKLEGHRFKGTNGVSPIDQVADSNSDVFAEEDWNLFAIKTTFSF